MEIELEIEQWISILEALNNENVNIMWYKWYPFLDQLLTIDLKNYLVNKIKNHVVPTDWKHKYRQEFEVELIEWIDEYLNHERTEG